MSKLLGRLVRGRKRKSTSDSDDAMDNLRQMENLLVRKQEHCEMKIQKEVEDAKKHSKTNKIQALAALRRKKLHEKELFRIDGVLMKIEDQLSALENAKSHSEVLKVLEVSNKALAAANKNMDIDKVSDLMDTIAEDLAVADEIMDAVSRPVQDLPDQDELLQELEQIIESDDILPDVPVKDLPGPVTRARSKSISRQSTIEALEQWAAA